MLRGCFADSRCGALKKVNGTMKDDHLHILRENLITVPSMCTEAYKYSCTSQILVKRSGYKFIQRTTRSLWMAFKSN